MSRPIGVTVEVELEERRRQFEVVCRTALKIAAENPHLKPGGNGILKGVSLRRIGRDEFGLSTSQCDIALVHAHDFLTQVYHAARRRAEMAA